MSGADSRAEASVIGVAIPIPEPWGSYLDRARAGAGDPQAAFVPSHLTLLGPTEIGLEHNERASGGSRSGPDDGADDGPVPDESDSAPSDGSTYGFVHIQDHLARVAREHRAFALHLRGTGTFRPVTDVVFVAVAQGISECEQLATAVRGGPLTREPRFPYHPHVTVAHDVPGPDLDATFASLADFDAQFVVDRFVLYAHGHDGRWKPLDSFPLEVP